MTPVKIQARWKADRRWTTLTRALRRSSQLSREAADRLAAEPGDPSAGRSIDEALQLLDEVSRQLKDLCREQEERDQHPPTPDASTWLTCEEAADVLGLPPKTIQALARRRLLWTRKVTRVTSSGEIRRVNVYEPRQLARLDQRTIDTVAL